MEYRSRAAKSISFIIIMLLLAAGLPAADNIFTPAALQAESTHTVEDMVGRSLEIPEEPERIVALGAGMMRKVAYFQAVDRVVGVEDAESDPDDFDRPYQLANPRLLDLPIIGPQHGGEAELIAGVEPDLILFYGDAGEAENLSARLEAPVAVFEFGDIYNERDTLLSSLELLGDILDEEERAEELMDFIEETIADLKDRGRNIETDSKAYAGGMSYRGSHGITSIRTPFPPFEFIGIDDMTSSHFDYETMTHVDISSELLLHQNPDYIFLDGANLPLVRSDLERRTEYQHLTALQEDRVYRLLPYASYHVNFASVLANSYFIGSVMAPEAFDDIEPSRRADAIYEKMLGEKVYEELAEEFGELEGLELDD